MCVHLCQISKAAWLAGLLYKNQSRHSDWNTLYIINKVNFIPHYTKDELTKMRT